MAADVQHIVMPKMVNILTDGIVQMEIRTEDILLIRAKTDQTPQNADPVLHCLLTEVSFIN